MDNIPVSEQAAYEKRQIFYPREYRRLPKASAGSLILFVMCVLSVAVMFVVFYSQISNVHCNWVKGVLSAIIPVEHMTVDSTEFLPSLGNIYFLSIPTTMPTFTHAVCATVVCVVGMVAMIIISDRQRAFFVFLSIAFFTQLISCLFFVIAPELFPYSMMDYSVLYMKQQIAVWIMITLVSGMAVALMNTPGSPKYFTFLASTVCSLIYGWIRYAVFCVILYSFSMMYMATLFFTFGVMFDLMQMVFIYALFIRYTSINMSTARRRLKWLWS